MVDLLYKLRGWRRFREIRSTAEPGSNTEILEGKKISNRWSGGWLIDWFIRRIPLVPLLLGLFAISGIMPQNPAISPFWIFSYLTSYLNYISCSAKPNITRHVESPRRKRKNLTSQLYNVPASLSPPIKRSKPIQLFPHHPSRPHSTLKE